MTRNCRLNTIFIIALSVFVFIYTNRHRIQLYQAPSTPNFKCSKQADNWIVITSINTVTQTALDYSALDEWTTVVVADTKTPLDYADYIPESHRHLLIYLSVIDQARLPFILTGAAPFQSYSRKNVGYQYAIACGAQMIYDVDDDNPLKPGINLNALPDGLITTHEAHGSEGCKPDNVVNPYGYFGRPDIWPRGYPLTALNHSNIDEYINLKRSTDNRKPWVEQFVADKDPDVDAVFRLTRGQDIGKVKFLTNPQTLRIASTSYSPYNAQTTMHHYDGLWALYLPSSVTMRVTDIWRSYITQRLMQETQYGSLVFRPAIVDQFRNVHNLKQDLIDEHDLYMKTEAFMIDLDTWKSHGDDLLDNMSSLYAWLAQRGHFAAHEITLVNMWIADLRSFGYKTPALHAHPGRRTNDKYRNTRNSAVCFTGILNVNSTQFIENQTRMQNDSCFLSHFYDTSPAISGQQHELYFKQNLDELTVRRVTNVIGLQLVQAEVSEKRCKNDMVLFARNRVIKLPEI